MRRLSLLRLWDREQFDESSLLKIVIRREGLGEPFLGHDGEGATVSQAPIFVEAITIQLPSGCPQLLAGRKNRKEGELTQAVDKLHHTSPMHWRREGVSDL